MVGTLDMSFKRPVRLTQMESAGKHVGYVYKSKSHKNNQGAKCPVDVQCGKSDEATLGRMNEENTF